MNIFPQQTAGSFCTLFKLLSAGLLFRLASISVVSWSAHLGLLLLEIPFFFFLFLTRCNTVYDTKCQSIWQLLSNPRGINMENISASASLVFRNVRKMIGLFYSNVWNVNMQWFEFRCQMLDKNMKI